jgi:hypothetical protein
LQQARSNSLRWFNAALLHQRAGEADALLLENEVENWSLNIQLSGSKEQRLPKNAQWPFCTGRSFRWSRLIVSF